MHVHVCVFLPLRRGSSRFGRRGGGTEAQQHLRRTPGGHWRGWGQQRIVSEYYISHVMSCVTVAGCGCMSHHLTCLHIHVHIPGIRSYRIFAGEEELNTVN